VFQLKFKLIFHCAPFNNYSRLANHKNFMSVIVHIIKNESIRRYDNAILRLILTNFILFKMTLVIRLGHFIAISLFSYVTK
jgi:hypothetical protein